MRTYQTLDTRQDIQCRAMGTTHQQHRTQRRATNLKIIGLRCPQLTCVTLFPSLRGLTQTWPSITSTTLRLSRSRYHTIQKSQVIRHCCRRIAAIVPTMSSSARSNAPKRCGRSRRRVRYQEPRHRSAEIRPLCNPATTSALLA